MSEITKTPRLYVDWLFIPKKFIYLGVTFLFILVLAAGAAIYVWAYGNPLRNVGKTDSLLAGARFVSFEGEVRVIRAATRETIAPQSDTRLYPGDTVQTQADGRARISMVDGSVVVVRPNSTVIIRDNTSMDNGQRTNVRVALNDGQINVKTEEQGDGTSNIVETRSTQSRLNSQTEGTFGINPETKTDEIRISTGSVETTTSSGEKSLVKGGEYVAVNQAGTVAKRERLLNVPVPSEPGDLAKINPGSNGSAAVTLRWQRPPTGAAFYRVEVATSPFFVPSGKVSERDQLNTTELAVNDLRTGNYFWRVRATAASGQVSEWSEPRKFSVASRGTGARVDIAEVRAELVGGNIYLITGKAAPGTSIRSGGRSTSAGSDGRFQLQVVVSGGGTDVTIEAQDPDGNASRYGVSLASGRVAQR